MPQTLVLAFVLVDPSVAAARGDAPPSALATSVSRPPPSIAQPTAGSERPIKRLRISGYIALALGSTLLGTTGAAAVEHALVLARLEARAAALEPGERLTPFERSTALSMADDARHHRAVAIATGVCAAASLTLATTFFLLARGRDRPRSRLALAPTWSPSGAGLTLQFGLR